jgi:Domain of unknown function (DUF4407)
MIDLLENIKGILIFCSGADRETLNDTKLSSEESKYVTIGALIVLTTLLACCSGGTAAHKFFGGNPFVTFLVIIFWGAFIFFLERYFMMSTKKFQTSENFWKTLRIYFFPFVVPVAIRISFSILLSLLIAFPLEAQIFHSSIKVQISSEDKKFAEDLKNKDKLGIKDDIRFKYTNNKIQNLELEKKDQMKLLEKSKNDLQAELSTGPGGIFNAKKRLIDEAETKIKKIEEEIKEQQRQKEEVANKTTPETDKIIAIRNQQFQDNTFGIEREISALNKLVEENPDMRDWHDLIRRVLIAIEIAPISLKILSPFSAYDAVLQSKEKRAIQLQEKYDENFKRSLTNEEIQEDLQEKAKVWRDHQRKLRRLEKEVLDTAIATNRLRNRKRRLASKRAFDIEQKSTKLTQVKIDLYSDRSNLSKTSSGFKKTVIEGWQKFLRLFGW